MDPFLTYLNFRKYCFGSLYKSIDKQCKLTTMRCNHKDALQCQRKQQQHHWITTYQQHLESTYHINTTTTKKQHNLSLTSKDTFFLLNSCLYNTTCQYYQIVQHIPLIQTILPKQPIIKSLLNYKKKSILKILSTTLQIYI